MRSTGRSLTTLSYFTYFIFHFNFIISFCFNSLLFFYLSSIGDGNPTPTTGTHGVGFLPGGSALAWRYPGQDRACFVFRGRQYPPVRAMTESIGLKTQRLICLFKAETPITEMILPLDPPRAADLAPGDSGRGGRGGGGGQVEVRGAHQGTASAELQAPERDQAAVQVLECAAGPGEQEASGVSRAWDTGPRERQGWCTEPPALADLPERSGPRRPGQAPGRTETRADRGAEGFSRCTLQAGFRDCS